jgi:SAM-dependent methyltransferase
MNLSQMIQRSSFPEPWAEGDNIPWSDPGFSERMLREHLTQVHDAASRRFGIIDRHVSWVHSQLLNEQPSRVLDLGCGPGLYTSRLARLGHTCLGIDYSPASIRYARQTAEEEQLPCTYLQEDIRTADYGGGYDLGMLIFGEFNVFRPEDAACLLDKAWASLRVGGLLLLEPHPYMAIQHIGQQSARWYSAEQGLFSLQPHLCLEEYTWDEIRRSATTRHYIVDAATAEVTRYAGSMQAYTDDEYLALLASHRFGEINFYPSLAGQAGEIKFELIAITARKA